LNFVIFFKWASQRLWKHVDKVCDEHYHKNLNLFFKSIYGTLNRTLICCSFQYVDFPRLICYLFFPDLLLVDRLWFGRITQNPIQITGLNQELFKERNQLKEAMFETQMI
jgi:uncharacterized damage-inducible protein DinB